MLGRITILAAVAVVIGIGVNLGLRMSAPPADQPPGAEPPKQQLPAIDLPAPAPSAAEPAVRGPMPATRVAPEMALEPAYAGPAQIENAILQLLARHSQLELVSINSVECNAVTCEIAFSGTQVGPRVVGQAEMAIQESLFTQRWADVRLLSGSVGTRELAPGARETVFSFEYQPLVDLSDDPIVAARQQARCSAAWVRQTEKPTPDVIARQYLDMARQRLALASAVLGEQEAERIAAQTNGGPLIRECGLTP